MYSISLVLLDLHAGTFSPQQGCHDMLLVLLNMEQAVFGIQHEAPCHQGPAPGRQQQAARLEGKRLTLRAYATRGEVAGVPEHGLCNLFTQRRLHCQC